MKIYISADIEGVTGINHWDETEKTKEDYEYFAEQMTREVESACKGATNAGADEIWIKDAHETGRNLDPLKLPENIRLIRGWSGHPFSMVQGLDESFDALMYIGYHSWGGSNFNPLAHTMHNSAIDYIKLNGELCSEFLIHSYIAAYLGVPVAFLSGDKGLCEEVNRLNENIVTVAVNEGIGNSTISIHPDLAIAKIKKGVEEALKGDLNKYKIKLPDSFKLEIRYSTHQMAYRNSFYPNAKQIEAKTIVLNSDDYFDILRGVLFLT
ncbi:amino acid amidase [Anaerosalibacter bizertensis]|uniref:Amino acid amidase n=1 Tax=Anaerosalibacter bizertensis TaxID=932217 RepID=A0A844FER7_9FIRM|nr:M55 family metallopeptidase [Anaerosalibacter bizertensis]MBV1817542.1 M55 family metallopeptidase [Bacteroidales bacterium MSK.15.36]HHV25794.1 amino acid amidase [Tissierellia bacterium]MBU5292876.1 M55 family metallopeptidase [Anaerosalibacter bizertensis]MCB5558738.1 M55 family metallopeptidase [Anaerosalibacter bizertensis]MCG4564104.1 M55 family metallopeptidase [Anaerosalibacter bizertensis]